MAGLGTARSFMNQIDIALPILIASWLTLAALYSLIGVAFSLSFRIGKFFDLSLGVSFLAAGYASYAFVSQTHLPLLVSMALGVAVGALASALLGTLIIAPLTQRLDPLSLFVATLALLYMAQSSVSIVFGDSAHLLVPGVVPNPMDSGGGLTSIQSAQIIAVVGLLGTLLIVVQRTRVGRFARAIADDSDLALTVGMPVPVITLAAYIVAGSLAGLAGVFYAADRVLEPTQAMGALLAAMVATIIGGESFGGAVIGACMLAGLQTALGFALPGDWKTTVSYAVLLLFMASRGGGAVVTTDRRF